MFFNILTDKIMDAKERILKFLEEINENANSLGRKLGNRDGQKIYYVIKGRNGISDELASKIKSVYPWVSKEWLANGYGFMYERENAMQGYSQKLLNLHGNKPIGEEDVMDVIPEEGMFSYIMTGTSMYPDYISGDILGCQVVNKDSVIEFGRKFLIKTENGILVRKIMPGDSDGSILLISTDDRKYPPITLRKEAIKVLAIVNDFVRRD